MKKILIMVNSLYGGGAEKVLQNLLNNLDSNKYAITLYSLYREPLNRDLYSGNFTYKSVFDEGVEKTSKKRKSQAIRKKIKGYIFYHCSSKIFYYLFIREKFDIEIAFIEGESTKIVSGSRNKKSRKYAWVHVDLEENPWTDFIYKNLMDEKKHYLVFDKIFCVSDTVRLAFIHKYNLPKDKVFVKYNPINRDDIIKKANETILPKSNRKIRMISVGRLVKQKGYDRLLNIAKKLLENNFDFEIYILGDGNERTSLEKYIYKNNLDNVVLLLGYQDNPYTYMKSSDLFICSSRAEGYSTVVAEALILGLPIISTHCAGIEELFGKHECGIITENNERSLYNAITNVLNNMDLLHKFRKESFERGKEFSLEKNIQEIERLFDE